MFAFAGELPLPIIYGGNKNAAGEVTKLLEEKFDVQVVPNIRPSLEEEKERIREDVHEKQEKIGQIEKLMPKLEKERKKLQEDIGRKQDQISQIDEQLRLIQQARNHEM